MVNVLKLFKLQLDNTFDAFKVKNIKAMAKSLAKYFLLIFALSYIISNFLNSAVNLGVIINTELMAIAILVVQVISLLFALGSIINKIYLSKDNELLMALPTNINQIFISKIMVLYVSEVIFNSILLLPIFISVGLYAGFSVWFYLGLVLFAFVLPILPIALALLLSIPTMYIYKFFKNNFVLSIVFSVSLISVLFYFYMQFIGGVSGAFNITEKQIENILKINLFVKNFGSQIPLFSSLATGMISIAKTYNILIYLLISLVILAMSMLIIKPFYSKVAIVAYENKINQNPKPKKYVERSAFRALLVKEIKLVFRSPSYVFQYFLFTLLMPIIVLAYDNLLITMIVNQVGQTMIMGAHILSFSVMAIMSNIISSSAISREGGSFYISKITPVSYYKQTLAKLVFNAIFTVSSIIVTTVLVIFVVDLNVWEVIFSSIIIIFVSLGHIIMCFDIDLRNPTLDWYDTSEITSVSKNTTKGILLGLTIPLFMCFVMLFLSVYGSYVPLTILFVFAVLFFGVRAYMLYLRTNYYYKNIEI